MKTVKKRMKGFKKDLSKWKEYDLVLVNDNLNDCYKKIMYSIKNINEIHFDIKFIKKQVKKLLS